MYRVVHGPQTYSQKMATCVSILTKKIGMLIKAYKLKNDNPILILKSHSSEEFASQTASSKARTYGSCPFSRMKPKHSD